MYRTRTCGDLRLADEGLVITLAGWVQKVRNLGAMTFIGEGELGTLAQMGPLYFPKIVGACLALTGAAVLVKSLSFRSTDADKAERFTLRAWRPMPVLVILGSAVIFALTLLPCGFLLSAFLTVFASTLAHPAFAWKRSVLLAAGLTALTALIFVYGMGLSVTLLPPALDLV